MKIKYIIDLSPITDQFVLLDTRDGDGADINHEVAMSLFNECPSESFFSTLAIERIESLERRSKELFEGTTEALSHLTAIVLELQYNIGMTITMTLTELDKAFNEALADGDRSAVEFYDRQIYLKMQAMDESGELDHYD